MAEKNLQMSGSKESEWSRQSVIAEVDFPNRSETTESNATLQTVSAFWYQFFSLKR